MQHITFGPPAAYRETCNILPSAHHQLTESLAIDYLRLTISLQRDMQHITFDSPSAYRETCNILPSTHHQPTERRATYYLWPTISLQKDMQHITFGPPSAYRETSNILHSVQKLDHREICKILPSVHHRLTERLYYVQASYLRSSFGKILIIVT